MGILSRFTDIISANINELLDRAENPEKMIDQYLRNAMENLAEVKKETAAVMAEESRCKRLVVEAEADIEKYTELAKKAIAAGNDGDAKVFIAKKQEIESLLTSRRATYDAAHANAQKMREMHDKLVSDIEKLKARRANIKATISVAKTQERVNKVNDAMDGARGSVAAFERMEEKAQRMLDQANAAAALSAEPEDTAAALEAKYSGGGDRAVDDELARLKAELGQ
ncbi:MAG: PspA/IM30 family protein [Butyricicoccus sp.]|nr:PspA/IM30 family protein [Butyricicoccus sp.]